MVYVLSIPFAQCDTDNETLSQDDTWEDEGAEDGILNKEEMAYLSDMLGPRGTTFDNDAGLDIDDDDLKADPVSQIDIKVSTLAGYPEFMLTCYHLVGSHPWLPARMCFAQRQQLQRACRSARHGGDFSCQESIVRAINGPRRW